MFVFNSLFCGGKGGENGGGKGRTREEGCGPSRINGILLLKFSYFATGMVVHVAVSWVDVPVPVSFATVA